MRKAFFFLILTWPLWARAQKDTVQAAKIDTSHLRISILTCGVGEELYSSFGHTAVRITDSVHHTDEVYNYGTFNFGDPDFYTKFTLGKLPYFLDKGDYRDFMYTYEVEKRNVREQVLHLDADQKLRMLAYLENNLKPGNREYRYDFLFDNCATRVRDILPKILGPEFYYGDVLHYKKISYRYILNQYLSDKHWERFGINLLLGSKVDSIMTDEGAMFLPDFIFKGLVHAKYRGQHVVGSTNTILNYIYTYKIGFDGPLWLTIGLLIITVACYLVPSFAKFKNIVRFLLLFVSGLLGIFMLFMWLGTNHQSCADNFNVLWAVPFNVAVAFVAHKKKQWLRMYALAAISLLIVALLVSVLGFQQMPLIELAPLMLALMYVYVDLYKHNLFATKADNSAPQYK
ncbi:MAG: DUF4105 domain-containing protein [Edaphocola sp.]